jgi:CheY-like chemotaxis protein
MGEQLRYCMCCGEDVPTVLVYRDGREELNCIHCGFTLGHAGADAASGAGASASGGPGGAPATGDAAEPALEPIAAHAVRCIIAVDDAETQRSVISGLLERSGLAREVVSLQGGAALVAAIAARFAEALPVDLVILDVEMPAMDGFTAARFLRSLEAKMRRPPCPIVFFTGRKADENLRRQMALFRPAWYCAKGVDADQAAFERRAAKLIGHVTTLLVPDRGA